MLSVLLLKLEFSMLYATNTYLLTKCFVLPPDEKTYISLEIFVLKHAMHSIHIIVYQRLQEFFLN